jgi:hypothetical protein
MVLGPLGGDYQEYQTAAYPFYHYCHTSDNAGFVTWPLILYPVFLPQSDPADFGFECFRITRLASLLQPQVCPAVAFVCA